MFRTILMLMLVAGCWAANGQDYDEKLVKTNKVRVLETHRSRPGQNPLLPTLTASYSFDSTGHLLKQTQGQKSIRYKYDSLGRMISQFKFDQNNKPEESHVWKYSKNGELQAHVSKYTWDKEPKTEFYAYNDQQKLIETYTWNDSTQRTTLNTFTYYANGGLKEKTFVNGSFTRVEHYDTCGHLQYKDEGGNKSFTCIEYTDSCRVLEKDPYNSRKVDTLAGGNTRITKNYGGWKTIETFYASGALKQKEKYSYFEKTKKLSSSSQQYFNEKGQLTEEKTFYSGLHSARCANSKPGTVADLHLHAKYQYFPNGLLKRQDFYNTKGQLKEFIEYYITYYP